MLELIQVLLKVIETGSFSKAGAQLNMAPSSVARKMDSLEALTKTTLLKRSTRSISLTEDGITFVKGARPLVEQSEALLNSVSPRGRTVTGLLSVSVFESFGRNVIGPWIAEFLALYPSVTMQIEYENRVVDLYSDPVDIAIRIGKPKDSGLKARKLIDNHTQVLASERYLSRRGIPNHPDDLIAHNCLTLNRKRQQTWWYFRNQSDVYKVEIKGNLTSTGGEALLSAAIDGAGIVQLPSWMSKKAEIKNQLVPLLTDWKPSLYEEGSGSIYAYYANTPYLKPGIRAFIDFLVNKMNQI